MERLATGCRWAEGPVYFGDGRYLLWSDIPNNRILKWEEETGAVSVYRKPSNFANGNTRDRQGRLVTCLHGGRSVVRTEYDGSITVLADSFDGKRLNSPNDVVVKSDGSIWFTDPVFGILADYEGYKAEPEIDANVYRCDPDTRSLAVVAEGVLGPNGLCFSPDEKILYIVESRGVPNRKFLAYDVTDGGTKLANKRVHHRRRPRHARRHALRCRRQPVVRLGHGLARARRRAWCLPPTASRSAALRCPSVVPTSASAASSATACSWPRASRSTRSTSTARVPPAAERGSRGNVTAAQTNYVADPGRVRELAAAIAGRTLSPVALARRYLDRIAEADPHVQCWREVDGERALAVAAEREAEAAQGRIRGAAARRAGRHQGHHRRRGPADASQQPLAGFRAARQQRRRDRPRAQGAGRRHPRQGAHDRVRLLRSLAGAQSPQPRAYPWRVQLRLGGGGGCRHGAGGRRHADGGLGEPPGRLLRDRAFKPSTRSLSVFGITPLGPSYDTPGFYGWSVDDADYVYEAVAPNFLRQSPPRAAAKATICIPEDPHTSDAIPEIKAMVDRLADAFAAAGHKVEQVTSPISFERLFTIQRSTMTYEVRPRARAPAGAATRHGRREADPEHPQRTGNSASAVSRRARRDRRNARRALQALKADVFLWPAAPATAPEGLGWTGDPKYISPWTALGGPIVTIPAGFAANALPIAAILAFSNRDGKGKRKVIDLASLSSFQVFLWFDRAAGFPSPRPQDANADARRSCQGWPLFAATEGLAFT